jgi:hypothetical protein
LTVRVFFVIFQAEGEPMERTFSHSLARISRTFKSNPDSRRGHVCLNLDIPDGPGSRPTLEVVVHPEAVELDRAPIRPHLRELFGNGGNTATTLQDLALALFTVGMGVGVLKTGSAPDATRMTYEIHPEGRTLVDFSRVLMPSDEAAERNLERVFYV